jgi:hypothetical protein
MKTKLISCSVLLALLCACSGGEDESTGTSVSNTSSSNNSSPADSTPNAKIIDNEDLTAGLKGIDANNNGIRDDIDRLISQKYSATPQMKKAAEQKARTLQNSLEVTDKIQARIMGNEIRRAGNCARRSIPDIKVRMQLSKEIEALTANTKERFTAYWRGNELAGGMVFSQSDNLICD